MQTIINKSSSLLVVMMLIFALSSCDKSENETFIRVQNISSYDFEELTVVTYGITFSYGTVESESSTEYETFEHASNTVSIFLKADDKDFFYFTPSYLGEQVFTPGNYTFILDVDNYENAVLSFEIKKD